MLRQVDSSLGMLKFIFQLVLNAYCIPDTGSGCGELIGLPGHTKIYSAKKKKITQVNTQLEFDESPTMIKGCMEHLGTREAQKGQGAFSRRGQLLRGQVKWRVEVNWTGSCAGWLGGSRRL